MPNLNIPFFGSTLVIPGAYYEDNVSAALPDTTPVTPPLIVVGYGQGPRPGSINTYSSTQAFQNALRGSQLAAFVPFIATPSPQLNGAQIITFIDVSSNTQSSFQMFGGGALGSGAIQEILVTSVLYGLPSNLLQISVTQSSLSVNNFGVSNANSSRKITLYDTYSGTYVVGDNLGCPLQVAYSGTGTTGSYTVTVSANMLSLTSANSVESISVPLGASNYATVSAVSEYINGSAYWTSSVLSNGDLPSGYLDTQTLTLAPSVSGVLQYAFLTSTVKDPWWWLNNHSNGLVTAVLSNTGTVSNGPSSALTPTVLSNFTGGQSIPPVSSSYASGLNIALTTPGWAVITDSSAAAVQQFGAQHAQLASTPGYGKWRRFVTGSNLGDSVQTTVLNAQSLNSYESTYVYPGITRADPATGLIISRPGLYTAAAVAAMMTGNSANVALTRKGLTASGVEVPLTISQIDYLQQNGVMPVGVVDQSGVPRVISDLTTWLDDNNPENVFNQQVAERFYTAYSLVNTANNYVGTTADPLDELRILNAIKATLNALTYGQGNPTGVISSWDNNSLVLNYTGSNQTAAVQVNVTLVGQNRFITIYVPIQPLNLTISASSS